MYKNLIIKGKHIALIFRLGSFWMGVHYSSNHNSYCIALLPCFVIRIADNEYSHDPGLGEK